MKNRLNILYIFTDQQAAFALSCAGSKDVHTPNIDRLASHGVRFTNAYCPYPLCTPSRAGMFTGLAPHESGVTWNDMAIRTSVQHETLGRLLSANGYNCAYGGKWHVPEISMPENNEFGFRVICGHNDTILADRCADFLKTKPREPFFLTASFDNPHNICERARHQKLPWGEIKTASNVMDCPVLPANSAVSPYAPEILLREQQSKWQIYAAQNFEHDEWRCFRYDYFRLIEKVDKEIGKILTSLDTAGLTDRTVIIFSSDHGEALGAHGWNQKTALYEECVRVPLIIAEPGMTTGKESHILVNNGEDFYTTVLDYAGIPDPANRRGVSIRAACPELNRVQTHQKVIAEKSNNNKNSASAELPFRQYIVTESFFGECAGGPSFGHARMLRSDRYKYAVYASGRYREQLHDIHSDPGEMINLAVSSSYKEILQEYRNILRNWCNETKDDDGIKLLPE